MLEPKATLTLNLRSAPEENLEGWYVADGTYFTSGVGILLVVSPAVAQHIVNGGDPRDYPVLRVCQCLVEVLRNLFPASLNLN